MADDAPLLHETLMTEGLDSEPKKPSNISKRHYFERGDIDSGFSKADVVYEHKFTTKVVLQGYIEPHCMRCGYKQR